MEGCGGSGCGRSTKGEGDGRGARRCARPKARGCVRIRSGKSRREVTAGERQLKPKGEGAHCRRHVKELLACGAQVVVRYCEERTHGCIQRRRRSR